MGAVALSSPPAEVEGCTAAPFELLEEEALACSALLSSGESDIRATLKPVNRLLLMSPVLSSATITRYI
jgi:hypothetical protein